MSAEKVTLKHSELGEMQVFPITVPSWRARGWEVAEPAPPPALKEPAGEQQKEKPPARPSRRPSPKESE